MQGNRSRDTAPELAVRRAMHALGLRYRVDIRPLPTLRRRADAVFTKARVAVFVDGCFWHGCPEHGRIPTSNRDYWEPKLARNVQRDRDTDERLIEAGWVVVRVFEHDDVGTAAARIAEVVRQRRASQPKPT
jgi:DNA mismatch endonuclease, patch repair protein